MYIYFYIYDCLDFQNFCYHKQVRRSVCVYVCLPCSSKRFKCKPYRNISIQRCNLTPAGATDHDGQVNVLSCLPDRANCLPQKAGHIYFYVFIVGYIFIVHVLDSNFVFLWAKARSEAVHNI